MLAIGAAVLAALALFAATNADDIVILTVLNVSAKLGGRPRRWQIWAGQYAGFTVLIGLSLAAAGGLTLVPDGWLWPLGLLPIGLGLVKLAAAIRARRAGQSVPAAVVSGLIGVAGLTIANGADNVSIYTPVFRTSSMTEIALTIATFMAGTAVYCLAGSGFAAHRAVTAVIGRWGQWIVPVVFIGIGIYVFGQAGVLR